jgi:hypothetical protein
VRIGFTGTRSLRRLDAVRAFLSATCDDGDEFTTGACLGFDAFAAHHLLDVYPDRRHRLVVPANRTQVDWSIIDRFLLLLAQGAKNAVVEEMPDGSTYKQRNERILDHADELVAVVAWAEHDGRSIRSGSWQTVRLARKRGLHAHLLDLSEL